MRQFSRAGRSSVIVIAFSELVSSATIIPEVVAENVEEEPTIDGTSDFRWAHRLFTPFSERWGLSEAAEVSANLTRYLIDIDWFPQVIRGRVKNISRPPSLYFLLKTAFRRREHVHWFEFNVTSSKPLHWIPVNIAAFFAVVSYGLVWADRHEILKHVSDGRNWSALLEREARLRWALEVSSLQYSVFGLRMAQPPDFGGMIDRATKHWKLQIAHLPFLWPDWSAVHWFW